MESESDFLSIEQAARYLGVTPGEVRRLLRHYGLGEFTRASMSRQVLIRRSDLDSLKPQQAGPRRRISAAQRRRTG